MWPTPAIVWDPWRCPPITRHVRRHNAKKLVQNEVFSHDLQCVEYGPRKLQKTQFSLVPRLCLDDSTQTKPPACPHGVGGWSPRCRIAWNGLHHPRESILAPIDVLGNLDLKNVWWILAQILCWLHSAHLKPTETGFLDECRTELLTGFREQPHAQRVGRGRLQVRFLPPRGGSAG